jgi:hypothetical protein
MDYKIYFIYLDIRLIISSLAYIYIKMNRRSLVSLKLKNGSTDLNNYFFILFALLQGWFKKKKKIGKVARKIGKFGKN